MATTSKTQSAKKATAKAAMPYAEQAAALATGTRALVEHTRDDIAKLADRITTLGYGTFDPADNRTADSVRRLALPVAEVQRALSALDLAAADLAREAGS